jgi:hypothetical protein
MSQAAHPTKEHIRQWLKDRQLHPKPVPTIERIQAELGWSQPAGGSGRIEKRLQDQTAKD